MKNKIDYSLYLVTDRDLMSTKTLEEAVEQINKELARKQSRI